jgi:hypothetical protein
MIADHDIKVFAICYPVRMIRLSGAESLVAIASELRNLIQLFETHTWTYGEGNDVTKKDLRLLMEGGGRRSSTGDMVEIAILSDWVSYCQPG